MACCGSQKKDKIQGYISSSRVIRCSYLDKLLTVCVPAGRGLSLDVLRECDRERETRAGDGEGETDRIS